MQTIQLNKIFKPFQTYKYWAKKICNFKKEILNICANKTKNTVHYKLTTNNEKSYERMYIVNKYSEISILLSATSNNHKIKDLD